MTGLTVESDSDEASYPWTDKHPADFQSNVTVEDGVITGDLTFIEGGLSPAGALAGDGWFIALKWSDPEEGVTSLKVGLVPSATGMPPQECIDDTDRNGVFKITPSLGEQKLVITQSDDNGKKTTQKLKINVNCLPADDEGV